MSDSHPASEHSADEHPVDFKSYIKICAIVFVAALCAISAMIWISYLPSYGWPAKVTLILVVASFNAFMVAGFLMHLLSEKKLVYTMLAFTVFFFAGLMGLTLYAMQNFPAGTQFH